MKTIESLEAQVRELTKSYDKNHAMHCDTIHEKDKEILSLEAKLKIILERLKKYEPEANI